MTQHIERSFNRRQVLKTGSVILGDLTIGSASASATPPAGAAGAVGAGRRSGNNGSQLVNAEQTADGTIIATDDNFVIAGQEIEVNSQGFYEGSEGTYVIYNDGYSGKISNNELASSPA